MSFKIEKHTEVKCIGYAAPVGMLVNKHLTGKMPLWFLNTSNARIILTKNDHHIYNKTVRWIMERKLNRISPAYSYRDKCW